MIGSQGISSLSRAAGDESLQRPQRINKDSHNQRDKEERGRGGKKSAEEEKQSADTYDGTVEKLNASPAPRIKPGAAQGGNDASATSKTTDLESKEQKTPAAENAGSSSETNDHIDLVG